MMLDISKPDPSEGKEARICARTSIKMGGSPFVEILVGLATLLEPQASEAVKLLLEEAKASLKRSIEEKVEREELLRGSFSELRSCEFIVPWCTVCNDRAATGMLSDARVGVELTKTIRALVRERLKAENIRIRDESDAETVPNPEKNHVYTWKD